MESVRPLRGAILLVALLLLGGPTGCTSDADRLEQVRELHARRQFGASLEPLRELMESRPEDPEVLYLYGVAMANEGRPTQATWSLREARQDPEWTVRANLALAGISLTSKNHPLAIEAAEAVLALEPENAVALEARAEARLESNDFEAALADTDRLLELDPDAERHKVRRLHALLGLERVEEAEALFAELDRPAVGEDDAPSPRLCIARAMMAHEAGDPQLASERFDACLERDPANPIAVQGAIKFYDDQRRFDRSLEIMRTAVETAPERLEFRLALAERLRAMGNVARAEELLLAATRDEPADPAAAWSALAQHYFLLEDFDAAVSAWEQVLEHSANPTDQARFGYADALVVAGQYERALAVADDLDEVYAELVRGRVLLQQGQPTEAVERFEAGLRLWPNNAVARYYAAQAAERAGQFDRAVDHYRESVRAGADQTDAGLQLARLHEAEGSFGPAYEAARRYAEHHPGDPEGHLMMARLAAHFGQAPVWRKHMASLARQRRAEALVESARTVAGLRGNAAAIEMLEEGSADLDLPQNAGALRALVTYLIAEGREDAARERAAAALAARPNAAVFHEIHGVALERSGAEPEEVEAAYQSAIELDPDHGPALAALARRATDRGDLDEALRYAERAAAADPSDVESRLRTADLLVAAGEHDEAERRLEALLDDRPYDGAAALALARLRLSRGDPPEQALPYAERAVRFRAGPEADALLTRMLLERGEADRAVELLRDAAERLPSPSLDTQLGLALAAVGEDEAAREALNRALAVETFSGRADAEAALARLDRDEAPAPTP